MSSESMPHVWRVKLIVVSHITYIFSASYTIINYFQYKHSNVGLNPNYPFYTVYFIAAPSDYSSVSRIVTFTPSNSRLQEITVQVPIFSDQVIEGNEIFDCQLSSPQPNILGVLLNVILASVTIIDGKKLLVIVLLVALEGMSRLECVLIFQAFGGI